MSDKKMPEIEFMIEEMKRVGVANASVKDGTVFLFDRSFLENMLSKNKESYLTIFVKNREFKD